MQRELPPVQYITNTFFSWIFFQHKHRWVSTTAWICCYESQMLFFSLTNDKFAHSDFCIRYLSEKLICVPVEPSPALLCCDWLVLVTLTSFCLCPVICAQECDSMSQEFAAMVQSSEGFQVAGWAFLKAFNRLKGNRSMMQSAMHMFGRYGMSSFALKRARALWRATNHAGPRAAAPLTSVGCWWNQLYSP